MTDQNQTQANQQPESKTNDKELNFRALEAKYQRQLEQERQERDRLQRELDSRSKIQEEDKLEEPYVDENYLNKKLNKFGQNTQSEIQKAMEIAKHAAKEELKQEMWLENNPDFYDVLQHAEKFAQRAPKLAETILKMPEGFERQKLVYQNIKELGVHKPEQKQSSIQDTVDAKKRNPYYQPSGVGTAPYSQSGDFSTVGQKNAYEKMKQLQQQLRL